MRHTTMPEGWRLEIVPWPFEDCPTHVWAQYWDRNGDELGVAGWDERCARRAAILSAVLHERGWFEHGRPGHSSTCDGGCPSA